MESLGGDCFHRCILLSDVIFVPAAILKIIGISAFYGCTSLQSLNLPSSVEKPCEDAFHGCTSLSVITFEAASQLTEIDIGTFAACSSLTSNTIPKRVYSIRERCFMGCSSLRSLAFESGSELAEVQSQVFTGCNLLESLWLPATLIERFAPFVIPSLKSVTLVRGTKLQRIERSRFEHWFLLESIVVPESVEVLGHRCFRLSKLSSLTFEPGSKLWEIRALAFDGCESLNSLLLPASVSLIDASAFGQASIEEIGADEANPHYYASGSALSSGRMLIRCFRSAKSVSFNAECATRNSSSILLTNGDSLVQIGPAAFSGRSKLNSICIPASVEILGEEGFSSRIALSEFQFESGSSLSAIGG
jgi:hypothetical protein